MDVILQTGTDNPFLALRDIHFFNERDGATLLAIRSGWICVNFKFYFALADFRKFVEDLEGIAATLAEQAKMMYQYEDHFIQFKGNGRGFVEVSGEFIELGPREKRVKFAFGTDQTCLRPFIAALHGICPET